MPLLMSELILVRRLDLESVRTVKKSFTASTKGKIPDLAIYLMSLTFAIHCYSRYKRCTQLSLSFFMWWQTYYIN